MKTGDIEDAMVNYTLAKKIRVNNTSVINQGIIASPLEVQGKT